MQKEAQIEDMMRRGLPLGAATAGNMSALALEAARLNVPRAGQDLTLLDGLRTAGKALPAHDGRWTVTSAELEDEQEEVAVNGTSPLSLARRR